VGELYYKDRLSDLKISALAHHKEIAENVAAARILLKNFQSMTVAIRPHFLKKDGIKNPEYLIDGMKADRKSPEKLEASSISGRFVSALKQDCKIVVIDLSKLEGKTPDFQSVARGIINRWEDFTSGKIHDCYVVYNGKAVKIDREMFDGFDAKNKTEKGNYTKSLENMLNGLH
jgi:hypothetical protein